MSASNNGEEEPSSGGKRKFRQAQQQYSLHRQQQQRLLMQRLNKISEELTPSRDLSYLSNAMSTLANESAKSDMVILNNYQLRPAKRIQRNRSNKGCLEMNESITNKNRDLEGVNNYGDEDDDNDNVDEDDDEDDEVNNCDQFVNYYDASKSFNLNYHGLDPMQRLINRIAGMLI
jgi:hypothetical protein